MSAYEEERCVIRNLSMYKWEVEKVEEEEEEEDWVCDEARHEEGCGGLLTEEEVTENGRDREGRDV